MYSNGFNDIKSVDILSRYYEPGSELFRILVEHGRQVAEKARKAAEHVPHLNPDLGFIHEAAMLHDIGIYLTHAPEIGCMGEAPYVCHGYLGRALLEQRGLHAHALACERHVGIGITAREIKKRNLPLPVRDMVPVSIEEKIVCYADKFFSKNGNRTAGEKTVDEILRGLEAHGQNHNRFLEWVELFGE